MHLVILLAAALSYSSDLQDLPESAKFYANAPVAQGLFGLQLAFDGRYAVVSSGSFAVPGPEQVWVFDSSTPGPLLELVPVVPPVGSSSSLLQLDAHSGRAAFGAPAVPATPLAEGAVHLFDLATGNQLHELRVNGPTTLSFGRDIAIEENFIAVSGFDNGPAWNEQVFLFDVATGNLLGELIEPTLAQPYTSTGFGMPMAADAGLVAVAAPSPHTVSTSDPGSVHIYTAHDRQLLRTIPAPDQANPSGFGQSVAMRGGMILIGAPDHDTLGAAFLFRLEDGALLAEFNIPEGEPTTPITRFGHQVALTEELAVITSPFAQVAPTFGNTYIYRLSDFCASHKLEWSDLPGAGIPGTGGGIAACGDTVFSGNPFDRVSGPQSGAVYVHEVSFLDAVGSVTCVDDTPPYECPCANSPGSGLDEGCVNSRGVGARLTAIGLPSASTDELELHLRQAVAGTPGVLLQGVPQPAVPFRDGTMCLGPPTERLQVLFTDQNGAGRSTVPIAATGQVVAGQTRGYQYWYRDPIASACGFGSNLSNGVVIDWN